MLSAAPSLFLNSASLCASASIVSLAHFQQALSAQVTHIESAERVEQVLEDLHGLEQEPLQSLTSLRALTSTPVVQALWRDDNLGQQVLRILSAASGQERREILTSDQSLAMLRLFQSETRNLGHRVKLNRFIPAMESMLMDPTAAPTINQLLTLFQSDRLSVFQFISCLCSANLPKFHPLDLLTAAMHGGATRTELCAIVNDCIAGGKRLDRRIAAYEGRTYVDPDAFTVPEITPEAALRFGAHVHLDYHALKFVLKRQGQACPVIIERVTYQQAQYMLEGVLLEEFNGCATPERKINNESFFIVARTLDGKVQAVSVSTIDTDYEMKGMSCKRSFKLDRDKETQIQWLGLAMYIFRFRYMKMKGYWYGDQYEVLSNIKLGILDRYRKQWPEANGNQWWGIALPGDDLGGFTCKEGEYYLSLPEFRFEVLS